MKRKTLALLLAAVMCLGALTACDGDRGTGGADPTEPAKPSQTVEPSNGEAPPTAEPIDFQTQHDKNIETVIRTVNESMLSDLGYTLDSDAELASIQFYDLFFTDKDQPAVNYSDLVVRYAMTFDEHEEQSLYCFFYKISDELKLNVLRNYSTWKDVLPMLEYLNEHSADITENSSLIYRIVDEEVWNMSNNGYFVIEAALLENLLIEK